MVFGLSGSCVAQSPKKDVVFLRSGIRLEGRIQSYDNRGIVIRVPAGTKTRNYPVKHEDVERIEIAKSSEHEQAEQLAEKGDFQAAIPLFQAASKKEIRGWLRSRILQSLLDGQQRTGDNAAALDTLRTSTGLGIPWSAVPIHWLPEPAADEEISNAIELVRMESALHQVVGASFLFGSDHSQHAKSKFEELVKHPDKTIQQMASIQLWRWRLESLDAAQLQRWEEQLRTLPPDMRSGAWFVLGLAYRRLGRDEDAALAFLWPAVVESAGASLRSRSWLRAGEALVRHQQHQEARRVWTELVNLYPQSRDAASARLQLQRLKE